MKYTKKKLTSKEFGWLLRILTKNTTIMQSISAAKFVVSTLDKQREASQSQLIVLKFNTIAPYCYSL